MQEDGALQDVRVCVVWGDEWVAHVWKRSSLLYSFIHLLFVAWGLDKRGQKIINKQFIL